MQSRAQGDPTTPALWSARGQQLPAWALGCSYRLCSTGPPCKCTQHGWIQPCIPAAPQSSSLCPPAALRQQGLEVGVRVLGTKPAQQKAELLGASRVPLPPQGP